MKRVSHKIKETAYHEAGHLVAAIIFRFKPYEATIVPNKERGSAGHVCSLGFGNYDPYPALELITDAELKLWKENKKQFIASVHDDDERVRLIARKKIIEYFAGHEAQKKITPNSYDGAGSDRIEIAHLFDLAGFPVNRFENLDEYDINGKFRTAARKFVVKHWNHIEMAAELLLEKKTLDKNDIQKLSKEIFNNIKIHKS